MVKEVLLSRGGAMLSGGPGGVSAFPGRRRIATKVRLPGGSAPNWHSIRTAPHRMVTLETVIAYGFWQVRGYRKREARLLFG